MMGLRPRQGNLRQVLGLVDQALSEALTSLKIPDRHTKGYACLMDEKYIFRATSWKNNNVVSDQVRNKLACAVTEDG